jgi:hypothetical protein
LQTVEINTYWLKVKEIPIAGAFLAFAAHILTGNNHPIDILGFFLFEVKISTFWRIVWQFIRLVI